MKSNIFLPDKIRVGYRERSDTYTGKLAFIIYYDNKGKIRQERSWDGWRDSKIKADEFENKPLEGFVLNKKAGGYSTGWNHRNTYVRVYDPRGVEFEISVSNLLYILENTNSVVGKGLEGEFVYGWSGKDLVLIPCSSPDYKELKSYSNKLSKNKNLTGKDMIVGATYLGKDNSTEYIYMGKFDKHISVGESVGDDEDCDYINKLTKYREKEYGTKNIKKHYYFVNKSDYDAGFGADCFEIWKTIGKNIIECLNEDCDERYPEFYEKLELDSYFDPYCNHKYTQVIKSDIPSSHWGSCFWFENEGRYEPIHIWKSSRYNYNGVGYLYDQYNGGSIRWNNSKNMVINNIENFLTENKILKRESYNSKGVKS